MGEVEIPCFLFFLCEQQRRERRERDAKARSGGGVERSGGEERVGEVVDGGWWVG